MAFVPTPKQAELLWLLLFSPEAPMKSKVGLKKEQYAPLVDKAKWLRLEKRGRAEYLFIDNDDAVWAWAKRFLEEGDFKPATRNSPETTLSTVELPPGKGGGKSSARKSKFTTPFQKAVLDWVKVNLSRRQMDLTELLPVPQAPSVTAPIASALAPALAQRIRDACLAESGGEFERRVRLSRLRARLAPTPRAEVDAALIELQNQNVLGLHPLDDPGERYPEDEEAAVLVAGSRRHIVYLRR